MGSRRVKRNEVELPAGTRPALLTAEQAAAYLGVAVHWVRRQTCEGKMRKVQLGPGTVRYAVADLDEMVRERSVGMGAESVPSVKSAVS